MDDLVNYSEKETGLGVPPKGKHLFSMVQMGDKGQIVIPAKARKIFDLKPGDEAQGLVIMKEEGFLFMIEVFRSTK